ncbi:MAG: Holliday junction branch migration protein RuvA [Candidatus Dasytiphilus stammeri]
MIGRIRGIIIEKYPPEILLEVNGISYEVSMPITCFDHLPQLNCEVIIFTHFIVRSDANLLFGFNNRQEQTLFRELIKVNGIGPKLALSILSGMSSLQFISVIKTNDISTLEKLPGVGKKTAERLVMEMKDRLTEKYNDLFHNKHSHIFTNFSEKKNNNLSQCKNIENEAISGLISLGYKAKDAKRIIHMIYKQNNYTDCESLIREALRTYL